MKVTFKRRFKVYFPIAIAVILIGIIIALFVFRNKITAKDYFDSLNKSNYTKQIQTTTIFDEDNMLYQKIETIIFDGEKVYHQISEKQISSDVNVEYEQTITDIYYSKNKMYYFEDNIWKTEDFIISQRLKTYQLKTNYFSSLKFNNKFKTEGVLHGAVKNDFVNQIVAGSNLKNMSLSIVVNKDFKVQKFNINALTNNNRNVEIKNVYSYNKEIVNLPI